MAKNQITEVKNKLQKNYYLLILDKSGSMHCVKDATIDGFNEQIQTIKELSGKFTDQEFYVSLLTFNYNVDTVMFNVKAEEAQELGRNDYLPSGSTALYDAIDKGIANMQKDIADDLKDDYVDAMVNVVIFTDGEENHSNRESIESIPGRIKELQEGKKWVFSLVGTNHDVFGAAAKLHIKKGNTMHYANSLVGTRAAHSSLGNATRGFAAKRASGMDMMQTNYFEDENGVSVIEEDALDASQKDKE
jgi:uncharacterized protein YegL